MAKSFREILSEGTVVDFPTALAKRRRSSHSGAAASVTPLPGASLDPHERMEADFGKTAFNSKDEIAKHPLVAHLRDKCGFTIMKKGWDTMSHHEAHGAVLQLSSGVRKAKAAGARISGYPNNGVYFGGKNTGHFEDGYSGNTGFAIKRGANGDELADYLTNNSPHHRAKTAKLQRDE